jgi:mycoredoxin
MTTSSDESRSASSITVYWRPGCGFCASLRRDLDRAGMSYDEVNIWEQPDAAAFVRSVANGNETVPTVTVGSKSVVNPSVADIAELVVAAAG